MCRDLYWNFVTLGLLCSRKVDVPVTWLYVTGLFHAIPAWLLFVVLYVTGCETVDSSSIPLLSIFIASLSTLGTFPCLSLSSHLPTAKNGLLLHMPIRVFMYSHCGMWLLCSAQVRHDDCCITNLSTVHAGWLCHRPPTLHRSVHDYFSRISFSPVKTGKLWPNTFTWT